MIYWVAVYTNNNDQVTQSKLRQYNVTLVHVFITRPQHYDNHIIVQLLLSRLEVGIWYSQADHDNYK